MSTAPIFSRLSDWLNKKAYQVIATDFTRPWGGFFVLEEDQSGQFIDDFFPEVDRDKVLSGGKISPKILAVAPEKRLSWQYHFRRAERWRVLEGPVAVAISETDEQPEPGIYQTDDIIVLKQGTRHRLIGLDKWGVVAEIWQHTDEALPSDEEDIVRVQDDFKRT
jgi:mannose-6-phosphate isomerase-like protein (cupin superfamily)